MGMSLMRSMRRVVALSLQYASAWTRDPEYCEYVDDSVNGFSFDRSCFMSGNKQGLDRKHAEHLQWFRICPNV